MEYGGCFVDGTGIVQDGPNLHRNVLPSALDLILDNGETFSFTLCIAKNDDMEGLNLSVM